MNWWKNSLAFLLAPLGTPISLAVWQGIAINPRGFNLILSALPGFLIYATPVAYIATLLLGIPAYLLLLRKRWLMLPTVIFVGTLIGALAGLAAGYYIAGYDFNQVVGYFTVDLMSIYAPSAIAGMVSAGMFWVIRNLLAMKIASK